MGGNGKLGVPPSLNLTNRCLSRTKSGVLVNVVKQIPIFHSRPQRTSCIISFVVIICHLPAMRIASLRKPKKGAVFHVIAFSRRLLSESLKKNIKTTPVAPDLRTVQRRASVTHEKNARIGGTLGSTVRPQAKMPEDSTFTP